MLRSLFALLLGSSAVWAVASVESLDAPALTVVKNDQVPDQAFQEDQMPGVAHVNDSMVPAGAAIPSATTKAPDHVAVSGQPTVTEFKFTTESAHKHNTTGSSSGVSLFTAAVVSLVILL